MHDDHDNESIDFSALDPSRDELGWAARVKDIAARAARRPSIQRQLSTWALPAIFMAAAVAILVWGAALVGGREAEAEAEPAELLSGWAQNEELPATTSKILDVLGDGDAEE